MRLSSVCQHSIYKMQPSLTSLDSNFLTVTDVSSSLKHKLCFETLLEYHVSSTFTMLFVYRNQMFSSSTGTILDIKSSNFQSGYVAHSLWQKSSEDDFSESKEITSRHALTRKMCTHLCFIANFHSTFLNTYLLVHILLVDNYPKNFMNFLRIFWFAYVICSTLLMTQTCLSILIDLLLIYNS